MENDSQPRIALGVSGGIAAYKAIEILRLFQKAGCDLRVAMTEHATRFVTPLTFRALSSNHVIVDDYSPDNPDPIAHINFSQEIDLLVVAPATANVIAKFANGIADDFLTSTYLACTAPVLVAPAMNTTMLLNPATQRNIARLKSDGVHFVEPDKGEMACGTIGPGRLSSPESIVEYALTILNDQRARQDLFNERLLITVGATREAIDPVRFISNRSSGRMGFALAEAALKRGANVTLVAGVTAVEAPTTARVINVTTASEMHSAVLAELKNCSIFISTAAVADYTPEFTSTEKIKKNENRLELSLVRTTDILRDVAARAGADQIIVGFAAETENVVENAREKLKSKNLDMIVANDVSNSETGFESDLNQVTVIMRSGETFEVSKARKSAIAEAILDSVVKCRKSKFASIR